MFRSQIPDTTPQQYVEYKLARYDKTTKKFTPVDKDDCITQPNKPRNHCYLILEQGGTRLPITNDLVTVEDLQYRLTGGVDNIPQKLTVFMTLAIAPRIGARESLIKETKIHTQFTISVRTSMTQ